MALLWRRAALLVAGLVSVRGRVQQIDITGLVGDSIRLPCVVDEDKCGEVHNIQWYRGDGDTRVFIYSELADVDTSENMLQGRGYFEYAKGSSMSELEIQDLRADDESLYKCELTYLEVRDNCAVIQFVNLTTLAKPEGIRILLEDGTEATPGSVIGPFEEDGQLHLKCESDGGKPAASVTWWNNTINMGGTPRTALSPDGTAVSTSELRVPLSRYDLASTFECQSINAAVQHPLHSRVYVNMHVRPLSVELTGLHRPVLEGTKVTLVCEARGARPPANITWTGWPGTSRPQTTVHTQTDSTADTVSTLTLTASRATHLRTVTCEASNQVTRVKAEPPRKASVVVRVLYTPVAAVSPSRVAVNETDDVLLFCRYDSNPVNLTAVMWYKDGVQLDLSNPGQKFGGGTLENPSLFIKNTSRHDVGRYRCEVANSVGVGTADNVATVHVQFPPEVSLSVTPSDVKEADRSDVTLICDVIAGDPAELLAVRWYRDGKPLRTPDPCTQLSVVSVGGRVGGAPCEDGPGRLILTGVGRTDMANYSCKALNGAGWGPLSTKKPLLVHYPPQRTILLHKPSVILKGMPMTLTCQVADPGYPPVNKYLWMRGSHVITDIRTRQWRIWAASLEEDDRFGCVALNSVGSSAEGTALVDVLAKPQFIERPPLYLGALMNSSSISVTCRVECSPLCSLQWLKDDEIIENDSPFYSIETSTMDSDPHTNDLESIMSTLTWNMSAWPGQMLDRVKDNANYTCRSTANVVGPGVSSTAFFTVEYPPRNVTVSPAVVNVRESSAPATARCTANAFPEASFVWTYDGEVVQKGDRLLLEPTDQLRRTGGEQFVCHARNKHGVLSTPLTVLVQYKPECVIRQTEEDGEHLLLCEVDAVPDDVTFTWHFDNETLKEGIRTDGTVSTLTVLPGSRDYGTYSCHVNNTVGAGTPCEIQVAGVGGWQMSSDQVSVLMVVTTVSATAVIAAIACVILYLVCRRRRAKHRYGDPDPMLQRDAYYQREARALIRPSLLPGPPSNPDIAKLPASDSSTKSSTNGSGCSSYEARPVYESLAMHKTPSKFSRFGCHLGTADGTSPLTRGDEAPAPLSVRAQNRPPSGLSQNGSSGYGSSVSQEATPNETSGAQSGSTLRSIRSPVTNEPLRAHNGSRLGLTRSVSTNESSRAPNGSQRKSTRSVLTNEPSGARKGLRNGLQDGPQRRSTSSQRGEPDRQTGQQLLPIPQSPDLPETPLTHDKTTQSETNNNERDRPMPPHRGSHEHSFSEHRQGRRRLRRSETDVEMIRGLREALVNQKGTGNQLFGGHPLHLRRQNPTGPGSLASRGFYSTGPPGSRLCHADVAPPTTDARAASRRPRTSQSSRRRDGDLSAASTPVHAGCGVQGSAPGCGASSRVQKDYVPSEYAVLQFSGVSHEIDV